MATGAQLQSLIQNDPTPTSADVVTYTATFSEPATGLDASQFSLTANGVSGASIGAVTPVSGSNDTKYTIAVNTGTGDGTLTLGFQQPAGSFQPQTQETVGGQPLHIVNGDVNGDGRPDLVFSGSGVVKVQLGNGDGTFQSPVATGGTNPYGLALADFNGDSKLDLAFADPSGAVGVQLGKGDGTFQAETAYPIPGGGNPDTVSVGDLNGDGKADLAVADEHRGLITLLGNGDGTFQGPAVYSAGPGFPNNVALGDFNGDGKLDAALSDLGSEVNVLLGNGDGSFQSSVQYTTGARSVFVKTADFNEDGKLDLAVLNQNGNSVSILQGNGNGTFQPEVEYGVGAYPATFTTVDVNGDGHLDIAASAYNANTVSVLRGKGDGTFQAAVNYTVGSNPFGVTSGDFNADGLPDLASANFGDGTISILKNAAPLVYGPAYTIDKDKTAEVPSLTLAKTSLDVPAGGSVALGITASPVDFDDKMQVKISGLPAFESITAPAGDTVNSAKQGNTYTWTITAPAGQSVNGLTLSSSYKGNGHPQNTFTVTASNTTSGETATSSSQTMRVTDPPAAVSASNVPSSFSSDTGANTDGSLVSNTAGEPGSALLKALADVAHGLNMTVGYNGNTAGGGILPLGSCAQTANTALLGNYMASSLTATGGGHDGASIMHAPIIAATPLIANPQALHA